MALICNNIVSPATRSLLSRTIGRAGSAALNLLSPPLCIACDRPVEHHQALCGHAGAGFHLFLPRYVPVAARHSKPPWAKTCLAYPPSFTPAWAAMIYDDASKGILLGFKHADRTHGVKALAAHLKRAEAVILASTDLLMPVPLHRRRLYKRRYNQSALLAHALAAQAGIRACPDHCPGAHDELKISDKRPNLSLNCHKVGAELGSNQIRSTPMPEIIVYSGNNCPYCVRAKMLLKKKGAEFTEYNVHTEAGKLEEMKAKSSGRQSIPQIFIAGQHIGGCDDLYALDANGKLDTLLAQ